MAHYLLRRLVMAVMVAFTVSLLTFFLLHSASDPAQSIAGQDATTAQIEQVRQQYGLDRPLAVQYATWLGQVVFGDFGQSYYLRKPVLTVIASHVPKTLLLASVSILLTVLVAVPLGIAAALRPNSWMDRLALTLAVAAQAIPNFWLGLMLIILLAVIYPVLPVSGDATWRHYVLPVVVLGTSSVPVVMRLTRTGLLDVLSSDYMRTARSNGYTGWGLLRRHALRNAILPVVSVVAIQLGHKLGGSVVTESVFAINGVGRLALKSIQMADIPIIQALVFLFALTFVLLNLLSDLINAWLDPRIRLE